MYKTHKSMKSPKILLGLLVMALAVVSCKKETLSFENKAAVDAAGTYTGTWFVTSSSPEANDTVYYGSVRILPDEVNQSQFVGRLVVTRDDNPEMWPKSAMTNISHAGGDFALFNSISRDTTVVEGTYKMGSTFTGRIYEDGSAKLVCAFIEYITYYVGKKEKQKPVIMTYTFDGKKSE